MKKYISLCALVVAMGCNNANTNIVEDNMEPKPGIWRVTIALNDSVLLPFNIELKQKDSAYTMTIINADERIEVTEITDLGDSLKVQMPVFVNYLLLKKGADKMEGVYVNPDGEDYELPLLAVHGQNYRFDEGEENCCDINEKWAVKFRPGEENEKPAIAYFKQKGQKVTGTFLTETGDYRHLDGTLSGNKLQLSSFDGTHLYYFTAQVENERIVNGLHYSGRSGLRSWLAYRDDNFELRDADSLTFLKEGFEKFDFSFQNLDGQIVSLSDEQFDNKAVIVQILGSWCPNCMDETRYLKEVYAKYHSQGLEIVGLNFERGRDKESAIKRTQKMIKDLDIPYPILLAGVTRDDKAAELLPMLNHVMSYPTAIYLDRNHDIVKIHTGFSGPSTPVFDTFVSQNEVSIQKMLLRD